MNNNDFIEQTGDFYIDDTGYILNRREYPAKAFTTFYRTKQDAIGPAMDRLVASRLIINDQINNLQRVCEHPKRKLVHTSDRDYGAAKTTYYTHKTCESCGLTWTTHS